MRTRTRTTMLVIATVMSLAIATAAWGAPGGVKGKPGGDGGPRGPVEVSIEVNLPWAHEVGDTIFYTFEVTNDSGEGVTVTDELTGLDALVEGSTSFERNYSLIADDMPATIGDTGNLTNTVTATWASGKTTAMATVEVISYGMCEKDGDGSFTTDGVCIWKPGPGDWTISVMPDSNRLTRVRITVRDHVPGNWCPQGVGKKWRPGDGPVQTTVTIPALPINIPGWPSSTDGGPVCPIGGAGGDFFNVGTPSSFYLDTNGDVTVTPAS